MRVSTDREDIGYEAYISLKSRGYEAKVLLDGVAQVDCYTADDELGYVRKASLPLRAGDDGKIVTEELYGNVEIIEVVYKGIF